MNASVGPFRDRGRGMYGPFRQIVAVGPHEATGTVVTLECGHTWTLVPHMHMSGRSVGDVAQCGICEGMAKVSGIR